ncbi:biotin-dependent carboxyltransferase family protein [Algoriphagus sp. NG3]|uniref:5-oxoprolinase subunit C family protein n=1 Tax=unclassified Algoriphagus TaxID=2641541 RepID=UPI002A7F4BE5|nr:biotin-dependent carboxyltransferase family protein [Algoriphagus sp. NG3]WPR76630.1 biotin-dependent carboxyltransferase family protein [Algoriphagus sp. NG3]
MKDSIGYLKILQTGPGTSVQDLGRKGFAQYGVPLSGALDRKALLWVNHLLKNNPSDAALEICNPGFKVAFDSPTTICLAGAEAKVLLNGQEISSYGIQAIQSGDLLVIGTFQTGAVIYLGIKQGVQSKEIMGSRSWYQGITGSVYAKKADQVPYHSCPFPPDSTASKAKWNSHWAEDTVIEAYPGPEWELMDKKSQSQVESGDFTLSDLKNRMAIQLNELVPNSLPEMVTAPVFPGTVQLTSGGKVIILMRDAQVTGGYPRILQVTEDGLWILSQKKPGQKIRFLLKQLPWSND